MQRIHFCWFRWPSVETTLSRELFVSRSSQDEFHHIKVDSYSKFCCSEWWLSAVSKDCFHHNWLRQRILLIREFWLLLTQSESFFLTQSESFVIVDPIREFLLLSIQSESGDGEGRREKGDDWWRGFRTRLSGWSFPIIFCNAKFFPTLWIIATANLTRPNDILNMMAITGLMMKTNVGFQK